MFAPPGGEPAACGAVLLACFGADLEEDEAAAVAAAADAAVECASSNLAAFEAEEAPAGGLLFLVEDPPAAEAAPPAADVSRAFPDDVLAPDAWFKEAAAEDVVTFFLLVLVGSDPM